MRKEPMFPLIWTASNTSQSWIRTAGPASAGSPNRRNGTSRAADSHHHHLSK